MPCGRKLWIVRNYHIIFEGEMQCVFEGERRFYPYLFWLIGWIPSFLELCV